MLDTPYTAPRREARPSAYAVQNFITRHVLPEPRDENTIDEPVQRPDDPTDGIIDDMLQVSYPDFLDQLPHDIPFQLYLVNAVWTHRAAIPPDFEDESAVNKYIRAMFSIFAEEGAQWLPQDYERANAIAQYLLLLACEIPATDDDWRLFRSDRQA